VGRAEPASDGAVVRAVLAGDVEQFAVLVRRYRDRYARYAAHMLGSADAAEDAIQDALIRAFDQLKQCREPDRFAGWFFLILRNRCFAERRRGLREPRPLEDAQQVATSSDGPDGAVERFERRSALARAPRADAGTARGVRVEARGRVGVRGDRPTDGHDGSLAQDADAPGVRPAAG